MEKYNVTYAGNKHHVYFADSVEEVEELVKHHVERHLWDTVCISLPNGKWSLLSDPATEYLVTLRVYGGVRRDNPAWMIGIKEALRNEKFEILHAKPIVPEPKRKF